MPTRLHLHMKRRRVCIKTRSTPASLPLKGQVTKHTTVKWSIATSVSGINLFQIQGRRGGDSHIKVTWVIVVPFKGQNLRLGTPQGVSTVRAIAVPLRVLRRKIRQEVSERIFFSQQLVPQS